MVQGFFNSEDTMTEDGIARRRKMAQMLMQEGSSAAPVGHWTQGLSRVLSGAIGGYRDNQADKAEKGNQAYSAEQIAKIFGGGSAPAMAPSAAPSPAMGASAPGVSASMPGDLATYAEAIKKKESAGSGGYAAVGPTHPKLGRALGAYQVMEANVGPWSREALGREVTPDEFMKNPQIQDQIFQHKFGQYVQKFGNPQDAASAWFTGRPLSQGANAKDVLGTTGARYVQDFNRNIGQPPQMASAGGMTPDGMPTSPVPSNAPAMSYAPQAIANVLTSAPRQAAATPTTSPQQLAQAVTAPQAPGGGNNRAAALAAFLSDPRVDRGTKSALGPLLAQQLTGDKVSPVDLGDRIALMNSRGQVTGYLPKAKSQTFGPIGQDQYGNNQYGFIDSQSGSVKPVPMGGVGATAGATPTPGAPSAASPPMPAPPPGVNPKIWRDEQTRELVRGGPKMTEGESNANAFASRMIEAESVLSKFENEGTSRYNQIAGSVPVFGTQLLGKEAQQYDQAKRTFINSVLRKESGAAIGKDEFTNADKQYFPQPGDAPEVVKQKRDARRIAIEGMKSSAGKGFKEPAPKPAAPEGEGWQEIDGVRIRRVN